ncbi:MAG: GIY-YIG nuclease family protein [Candidatus Anammoxibacter sp.]
MWYLYLCNKRGQLYTGITTDIQNRMRQHCNAELLYTEEFDGKNKAAKRERQIKGWKRKKKLALIKDNNKE